VEPLPQSEVVDSLQEQLLESLLLSGEGGGEADLGTLENQLKSIFNFQAR